MTKSRYQLEFDALPAWAQDLVLSISANGMALHGYGHEEMILAIINSEARAKYRACYLALRKDRMEGWSRGFDGLCELAAALSAPFPPPHEVPPHRMMTTSNLVEMVTAGDDGCAFDQPCYFGHRVEMHAVYCHNEAWPDSPRKCYRSQSDPEFRHEDCPGFLMNKAVAQ